MRKDLGGELGEEPGKIVVLLAIGSGGQFKHVLAAVPQLLGIATRFHFTRLIRHLVHLNKKLTSRRLVPDISLTKPFHDLKSEFLAFSQRRERVAAR
jgi:hypothetical protein